MKNNILLFLFAVGLMITYTACEDNKEDYLDEFSTILYFLDSGEVPLTVYDVGEDSKVNFSINKGGSDPSTSSSVYVATLSEALLDVYNQEKGTEYVMLPGECYEFEDQLIELTPSNPFHVIDIEMHTSIINTLPEIPGKYVLPLELLNSTDSINAQKRHVFLAPNVLTPKVFFPTALNDDVIFTAEAEEQITFTVPVSISADLENRWSFDCTLEIDETLVDEYNEKYGSKHLLLPADAYTINTTVSFVPGDQTKDVNVTINRKDLRFGNFILPLRLVSCTKEEFKVDVENDASVVPITYTPPKPVEIPLTVSMVSTNAQEAWEGPIANLVDGDINTYFHSSYSQAIYSPYGHYIDVKLESPIDLTQFAYTTRHNNANGAPKHIELFTSSDGVNWTHLATINRGLPETTAADYTSTVMQAEQPFTYFRIGVKESVGGKMNESESAWMAMAELKFFGQLSN